MPIEKHPTKTDTLVFRGHPAARLWRPHLCFSCCHPFEEGDAFHSDAPGVFYHLRCYIAEVKASAKVKSTSNVSQE